jgi:hypothetical protein
MKMQQNLSRKKTKPLTKEEYSDDPDVVGTWIEA